MTYSDPIGDMFSRIRNGQMRNLNSVEIPSSNFRKNILEILKSEGYIKDYFIEKTINNKTSLKVSSTPKGVMSDVEARKQNVGGEIICRVF